MSTPIQDTTAAVNAALDEVDAALDAATPKLTGITDDVAFLKETIDKLQNNPGPISPEDQALLTAAQARVTGLVGRVSTFKDALQAIDDATTRPEPPPQ